MYKKLYIIAVIFSILILSGCSAGEEKIFEYRKHNATFTAVFSTEFSHESVTCSAVRSQDKIVMTVVSPERSAGITVTYDFSSVYVSVSDTTIPLSADASKNIKLFFDLLYPSTDSSSNDGSDESWTTKKSDDGLSTYLISPYGTVTLGEDLLPISVTVEGQKQISTVITDYVIADNNQ